MSLGGKVATSLAKELFEPVCCTCSWGCLPVRSSMLLTETVLAGRPPSLAYRCPGPGCMLPTPSGGMGPSSPEVRPAYLGNVTLTLPT